MKKTLIMLAAAAMILPAAFSCKKNNSENQPFTLADPVNKPHQVKVEFVTKASSAEAQEIKVKGVDGRTAALKSLELTNGQKAIAIIDYANREVENPKAVKAEIGAKVCKYTVKAVKATPGTTYEIEGLGTFTLNQTGDGYSITAVVDGETVTVNVTEVKAMVGADSDLFKKVAREWKVKATTINASGTGIPAGLTKVFNDGCNLESIGEWISSKIEGVSAEKIAALKGYNVSGVILTESGSVSIEFTGKDAFAGTLNNLDINAGTFGYVFESTEGNMILSARATGIIRVVGNKLFLTLVGAANYNETNNYNVEVIFELEAA
ncbi:MAG: hypothetical protein IJ652_00715 [Bacteroidales bacterium]|nr:hypothetical protein [Bacteroidales bacterium]